MHTYTHTVTKNYMNIQVVCCPHGCEVTSLVCRVYMSVYCWQKERKIQEQLILIQQKLTILFQFQIGESCLCWISSCWIWGQIQSILLYSTCNQVIVTLIDLFMRIYISILSVEILFHFRYGYNYKRSMIYTWYYSNNKICILANGTLRVVADWIQLY